MTRYRREIDYQQICKKGHLITDCYVSIPSTRRNFCSQCGSPTIKECPNCHVSIPGRITLIDTGYDIIDDIVPGIVPDYCENCGKPFPWAVNKKTLENHQKNTVVKKARIRKKCPKSVKEALWRKYFGKSTEGKCYVCEKSIDYTNYEAGHDIPDADGGEWKVSNLKPLCRSCNRSMGTMTIEDFKRKYFS